METLVVGHTDSQTNTTINQQNLSIFILSVTDLLQVDYKQSEYVRAILRLQRC